MGINNLVLLPYAGGSSYSYLQSVYGLKKSTSIYTIDYAGHGKRFREKPQNSFDELLDDVKMQFEKIPKNNLIIFGHSMGALVAAYISEWLHKQDSLCLKKIILSCCVTPDKISTKMNKCKTDEELFDYLCYERKISRETIDSTEFKNFFWSIIKNDFKIMREFDNKPLSLPDCPLYCIAADEDLDVCYKDVEEWKNYTNTMAQIYRVKGSHFYFEEHPDKFSELLKNIVELNISV